MKVYNEHRKLCSASEKISLQQLKNLINGKERKEVLLLHTFALHNQQMLPLIERGEYAKGTYTHFETTYKHVRSFIKQKFHCQDIAVTKVNFEFIQCFEYYLKTAICAHNTAMKYLGDLKKILLLCVKKDYIAKDPFLNYPMKRRDVQKTFLTDEELLLITNKVLATRRLSLIRDIFLFSCYTGLAYADVKGLKRSEIQTGVDGNKWIFIQRQKSGTPAPIPLLPYPLQILERYKEDPRCIYNDLALPVLCNQKMNEYLKELADICGLQKLLTYHTARYTFATTITLNNNVPIETVSKMLGHKSLKQTQHYASILNKKVGEDMALLTKKLNAKDL